LESESVGGGGGVIERGKGGEIRIMRFGIKEIRLRK
jgi:hypothetical protein